MLCEIWRAACVAAACLSCVRGALQEQIVLQCDRGPRQPVTSQHACLLCSVGDGVNVSLELKPEEGSPLFVWLLSIAEAGDEGRSKLPWNDFWYQDGEDQRWRRFIQEACVSFDGAPKMENWFWEKGVCRTSCRPLQAPLDVVVTTASVPCTR